MDQKISEKQIEAILNLNAENRFEHTIKQIVGWNTLWFLYNENLLHLNISKQKKYTPVWPAEEYLDKFLFNKKNFGERKKIKLDFFLEEIAPELTKKNIFLSVFPTLQDEGYFLSCESFRNSLLVELDKY